MVLEDNGQLYWEKIDCSDGEAPALDLWKMSDYPFITVAPSSSLTRISSTCYGSICMSNRTVQSIALDLKPYSRVQVDRIRLEHLINNY